uniref:Uncharacterized protein n=1 Tax=Arion vulgaris TaxID=1028688 RepID=A0A0B6ZGU3_9EUPU
MKPPTFGQNMTPALQKFMNKQNEVLAGKTGQGSVSEVETPPKKAPDVMGKSIKNGLNTGSNSERNENNAPASVNKNIAVKPTIGATKPSDIRRSSQVNVPSIFQQDSVNTSTALEGRRGSQVLVPEIFKPGLKNTTTLSEVNTSQENKKPKPFAKPGPVNLGSANLRPPPGPKPQLTSSSDSSLSGNTTSPPSLPVTDKSDDIKSKDKFQQFTPNNPLKVKLPVMDQQQLKKNDNSSRTSATLPSSFATTRPASPPNDGKVVDFRTMLRSTTKTPPTNPMVGKNKPANIKPILPPTLPTTNKVANAEVSLTGGHDTRSSSVPVVDSSLSSNNSQGPPDVPSAHSQLFGNKRKPVQEPESQSNNTILERKSDSKKFKNVKLEVCFPMPTPPHKPALPGNIDLTVVKQQYQRTIQILKGVSDTSNIDVDENDGEVYDDGISLSDVVKRQSNNRKQQEERISIIPDMSAEEEGVYDDGCTQVYPRQQVSIPPQSLPPTFRQPASVPDGECMYVDAETERQQEEDLDQVYEDEDSIILNTEKLEEDRKRRQREEAEAKKKEEKERKEREKEEEKKRKKEEKERAKKEKEEMQLRKNLI